MKVYVVKMDDVIYSKDLEDSEFRIAVLLLDKLFFRDERPP